MIQILGNLSLALFHIAALTLLYTRHDRVRRFLAPLGSVGRMPLTN